MHYLENINQTGVGCSDKRDLFFFCVHSREFYQSAVCLFILGMASNLFLQMNSYRHQIKGSWYNYDNNQRRLGNIWILYS